MPRATFIGTTLALLVSQTAIGCQYPNWTTDPNQMDAQFLNENQCIAQNITIHAYFDSGEYKNVLTEFDTLRVMRRADRPALEFVAQAKARLGDLTGAIADMKEAMGAPYICQMTDPCPIGPPPDADGYYYLSLWHAQLGHKLEAENYSLRLDKTLIEHCQEEFEGSNLKNCADTPSNFRRQKEHSESPGP